MPLIRFGKNPYTKLGTAPFDLAIRIVELMQREPLQADTQAGNAWQGWGEQVRFARHRNVNT